mmetsp:Transcript_18004/g.44984  ORF Transcript_18004/g.44984 Transcript_18004/m.44984 type:complete len:623 (+) Transcript_18004:119-1987(+)
MPGASSMKKAAGAAASSARVRPAASSFASTRKPVVPVVPSAGVVRKDDTKRKKLQHQRGDIKTENSKEEVEERKREGRPRPVHGHVAEEPPSTDAGARLSLLERLQARRAQNQEERDGPPSGSGGAKDEELAQLLTPRQPQRPPPPRTTAAVAAISSSPDLVLESPAPAQKIDPRWTPSPTPGVLVPGAGAGGLESQSKNNKAPLPVEQSIIVPDKRECKLKLITPSNSKSNNRSPSPQVGGAAGAMAEVASSSGAKKGALPGAALGRRSRGSTTKRRRSSKVAAPVMKTETIGEVERDIDEARKLAEREQVRRQSVEEFERGRLSFDQLPLSEKLRIRRNSDQPLALVAFSSLTTAQREQKHALSPTAVKALEPAPKTKKEIADEKRSRRIAFECSPEGDRLFFERVERKRKREEAKSLLIAESGFPALGGARRKSFCGCLIPEGKFDCEHAAKRYRSLGLAAEYRWDDDIKRKHMLVARAEAAGARAVRAGGGNTPDTAAGSDVRLAVESGGNEAVQGEVRGGGPPGAASSSSSSNKAAGVTLTRSLNDSEAQVEQQAVVRVRPVPAAEEQDDEDEIVSVFDDADGVGDEMLMICQEAEPALPLPVAPRTSDVPRAITQR